MSHEVFGASERAAAHDYISAALVLETVCIFAALFVAGVWALRADLGPWAQLPLIAAAGLWLDRMITVGHEAAHRKLFPDRPRLNDLVGGLMMAPLMVPMVVYRKIHAFHHGHNRRAPKLATLDVVLLPPRPGLRRTLARITGWLGWLLGVFCGGFYLHGLVSIVLFLLLPTALARRISPAFKGWRARDRARAWLELGLGVGLHALVWRAMGRDVWLHTLGLPTIAFAWVYSLLVYIYHYDTPIGDDIRGNVRSLQYNRFFSWLLLNFNEHATHHADPRIPWYRLPARRVAGAVGRGPRTLAGAVLQQLRGPRFVDREPRA